MLRVTPIYGSTGHHPSSQSIALPPSSTLIEYGGIRLLVNVGHDESINTNTPSSSSSSAAALSSTSSMAELPQVDAVLLTDSSLQSLGGLPYHYGQESRHKRKGNKKNKSIPPTPHTTVFATFPTVKMGQMTLYDHHANCCLDGGNPGYTLQDIDSLFTTSKYYQETKNYRSGNTNAVIDPNTNSTSNSNITTDGLQSKDGTNSSDTGAAASILTLKYAQTVTLYDPTTNKPAISITPHKAGHLIGASYYILKRLVDETEVVVAPIYHHTKEKHLDSSTLYKYGTACDVLITSCGGPGGLLGELYSPLSSKMSNTIIKRKLNPPSVGRDEGDLVETILSTLRRGGNVLLPVDASGRVLELVLLLNQHWEKHRLGSAYNLCWVGSMVQNTIDFAKSQLEWMAKPLGAQFDTGRGHPYSLKNMQIFSSVNELESELPGLFGMNVDEMMDHDNNLNSSNTNPTCVLASGATLDYGPARDLFLKWCENGDNAVILTDSRRCVMRGNVVLDKKKRQEKMMSKTKEIDGGNLKRRTSDAAIISDTDSVGSTPASSAATDTPNIVQEDEEVTGTATINIGTAISSSELSEFCTAGQLLLKWCEAKAADVEMDDVVDCDVLVPKRAALAGNELQSFLQREEEMRQRERAEEERLAMLREVELAKGRLRLNEADETKTNDSSGASSKTKLSSTENTDQNSTSRPKKKSRFDANLFLKFSKPCHMTFEVREEAVGIGQPDSVAKYGIGESIGQAGDIIEDDYGIAVKPEKFIDIVTGVDPSKYSGGGSSGRIGEDVLKRGLGFGSDGRPLMASSNKVDGGKEGGQGLDDMTGHNIEDEEMALEAVDLSEGNGIIRGRNNRPPVKVSTEPRKLEVLAEIAFIPLEGRVDARAARQSVRALQPRQVVILGGGDPAPSSSHSSKIEGEAKLLADTLQSLSLGERGLIFAPANNETVELNVGHAAYSVRLIDTPYMNREEKANLEKEAEKAGGLESLLPSSVELHEAKVGECTVSLLDYIATGQRVAADGSTVLAPRRVPKSQESAVMLSDGDVLLTDLRSEVIAQGMKAEYSAHTGYAQLIVNGKIVVRKDQMTGEINVEGPLCEDFFAVRAVVCGQYVTL